MRVAPQDEAGASQVQVNVEPALVYRRRRGVPLVQDLKVRIDFVNVVINFIATGAMSLAAID